MKIHLEVAKKTGVWMHLHLISGAFMLCRVSLIQKETIQVVDMEGKAAVVNLSAIMMITDKNFKAFSA